jgi:ChrB-like protein
MHTWVLLLYKLAPDKPSARRVFIWRKLKRLGALSLQDAVWVLPATPWTIEQFQWLAVEIREMGGTAMVWEARLSLDGQDDDLVRQFSAQVDATYHAILADLASPDIDHRDLIILARQFQQAHAQDYFHSALGRRVREALERAADRDGGSEAAGRESDDDAGEGAGEEIGGDTTEIDRETGERMR